MSRYGPELLEAVAAAVVKPRGAIAPEDRVGRIIGALDSPVVIDRRLRELGEASPSARHLLAVMAHARAFRMPLADAVSLVSALGHPDPLAGVRTALECGLVLPDLRLPGTGEPGGGTLHAFEAWLGGTPVANLALLLPPVVAARALPCPFGLPDIRQGEQVRPAAGQTAFLAEKARREELGIPPLEDEAPVPVDPVMPLGGPIEAVKNLSYAVQVGNESGTGSEVGRAGVIADETTHTKKVIFHPKMLPVIVICDPRLTGKGYGRTFRASLPAMPVTTERSEATKFLRRMR